MNDQFETGRIYIMKSPSILLVIEGTYPWYRGGVSEWVHQYIRAFSDHRFFIVQVATDQYLNAGLDEALYDLPGHIESFTRIPPPDLSLDWERESRSWLGKVRNNIEDIFASCNLVHIANTGFAGWLGMVMAEEKQKPLVLTEHALYWKEVAMGATALECGYKIPSTVAEREKMTNMFKELARQIYGRSDRVISVSQCNLPNQKSMGADPLLYIPNGVPEEWLEKKKERKGNFTIGWIGRCAEMKNPLKFFEVVNAFEAINHVDVRFMMMLCNANEPVLQQKVNAISSKYSNVKMIWNQPAEKQLPEMDALCITSHNESQPLVLFEALSKKVLPIGWQAGDVRDTFGLILKKGSSPEKLVRQVGALWENPRQWTEKVNTLQQKVRRQHTWENIFAEYRHVFNPLFELN